MRISYDDLYAQGPEFQQEVYRILDSFGPEDLICEEIQDDVEYEIEDTRFDYEYGSIRGTHGDVYPVGSPAKGRVTIEFTCLLDCRDEDTFELFIAKDAGDYAVLNVAVQATPVETLQREDVTVPFRGESLTYTKYKVIYEWETTGEVEES